MEAGLYATAFQLGTGVSGWVGEGKGEGGEEGEEGCEMHFWLQLVTRSGVEATRAKSSCLRKVGRKG